jgi:peptide/nickel transport system permease protein
MSGADAPAATPRRRSPRLLRLWARSVTAVVGTALVLGFVVMAAFAPWVAPHPPNETDLRARQLPPAWVEGGTLQHPLGTDQLGRDLLSRLIYGSRVALLVGLGGVLLTAAVGVTLGLLAGYLGGRVDAVISRLIDTLLAIPPVLLYLVALGVFGPSLTMLIIIIGLVNWTTFARVVRGEVLTVGQREFVEAARANGARAVRVMLRHVLPNVTAPILVVATLNVATIIILEASLSFLGFGVQAPTVTWGRMLADGRNYLATAWWLATFPGVAITLLGLGLLFVGDWLRDVLDPRLRGR